MSIYEFLERLEADPFDPALDALFLGKGAKPAQRQEENPPQVAPAAEDNTDGIQTATDGQALFPLV